MSNPSREIGDWRREGDWKNHLAKLLNENTKALLVNSELRDKARELEARLKRGNDVARMVNHDLALQVKAMRLDIQAVVKEYDNLQADNDMACSDDQTGYREELSNAIEAIRDYVPPNDTQLLDPQKGQA